MELHPGTGIGPYEVMGFIGGGGMGEVYRGRDLRLARDVAIKILPSAFASDFERLQRFDLEAKAIARLSHPNIVQIFDTGIHEGIPYLVMELVEGQSLRAWMSGKPIQPKKAADMVCQIAEGLGAAHAQGVIHRDLKPENILLDREGRPRILDFGLAKLQYPSLATDDFSTAPPSMDGSLDGGLRVTGTVWYMAPEQLTHERLDGRTDLFALGVILWEMLTGLRPFVGDTSYDTIHAILRSDLPDLSPDLGIPFFLERIARRCLEKDPSHRFQSARDLVFALNAVSGTSASGPVVQLQKRSAFWSRMAWIPLGVALALGLGAGLGWNWTHPSPPWQFRQVTSSAGVLTGAKFLDQDRVVFSMITDSGHQELFQADLRQGGPPVPQGIRDAQVLSVSPQGDIAVLLREDLHQFAGRLAVIPASGGAPRPIQDGVCWAGWGPDGKDLIIHHFRYQGTPTQAIEYPRGQVIFRAPWGMGMDAPVLSPDRKTLVIPTLTFGGQNQLVVIDLLRGTTQISDVPMRWKSLVFGPQGLCAVESQDEAGSGHRVLRIGLDGKPVEELFSLPQSSDLFDVSSTGQVLLALKNGENKLRWSMRNPAQSRFIRTSAPYRNCRLSSDGRVLTLDSGKGTTERWQWNQEMPIRFSFAETFDIDAAASIFLVPKEGPQGTSELWVQPCGPGEPVRLQGLWGKLFFPRLFPKGDQALVCGEQEPGHEPGTWVLNLKAFSRRKISDRFLVGPISPEGTHAFDRGNWQKAGPWGVIDLRTNKTEIPANGLLGVRYRPLSWRPDGTGFWVADISSVRYPRPVYFWKLGEPDPQEVFEIPPPREDGAEGELVFAVSGDGNTVADGCYVPYPTHLTLATR